MAALISRAATTLKSHQYSFVEHKVLIFQRRLTMKKSFNYSIKKCINFSTFALLIASSANFFYLESKCTRFPCQNAHRFDNHEFVKGTYLLDRLIFTKNFPNNLKLQVNDGGDFNFPITKNKLIDNVFYFNKQGHGDLYLHDNSTVVISDNQGNKLVVTRRQEEHRGNKLNFPDTITIYLFNKKNYEANKKNYGTKIVFDVNKFENLLTQTTTFDNLPGRVRTVERVGGKDPRPAIGSMKLKLSFDPSYNNIDLEIAFENRFDNKIEVKIESHENPLIEATSSTSYKNYDITTWDKDSQNKISYYNDLYKNNIIVKEAMTQDDYNAIKYVLE